MEEIKLLDCTLRDGGYINDWRFGKEAIEDMTQKLAGTGVEVLEVGFLKKEPYQEDRTVFNSMDQVKKLIGPKKPGLLYAVMCEVVNPLPLDMLDEADQESADVIRVIIWKTKHDQNGNVVDALEEGYRYCKGIVEKGYRLCVQPARVDQYSDEEFVAMVRRFSQLNPMALYVVDSWGTQNAEELLHYMHLADENMPAGMTLGYHGHNNMMQALPVAQAMLKEGFARPLMIDASVYGIGRGAGNLNLEIIAKYMNEHWGKAYSIRPMLEVNDNYIHDIFRQEAWGYSVPYYLTAKHNCNPNYARFYSQDVVLSSAQMEAVLVQMNEEERVIFKKSHALAALDRVSKKKLTIGIATNGNWGNVEGLLNAARHSLTYSGVDAVVLDYGKTDRAKTAVDNYLLDGCQNISYERVWDKSCGTDPSLDGLMRKFYSEHPDSQYLWFVKDCSMINFRVLDSVLRQAEGKDISCILFNPFPDVVEDAPEDRILPLEDVQPEKYFERFAAAGAMIVSREMAGKMLELAVPEDLKAFWQFWAIMSVSAREHLNVYLCRDSLFKAYWAPKTRCAALEGADLSEVWGQQWRGVLSRIPSFQEEEKNALENVKELGLRPFGPYDVFEMRAEGTLTKRKLRRYAADIERVSPGAAKLMKLALMTPRFLCRFLLRHKDAPVIRALRRLME